MTPNHRFFSYSAIGASQVNEVSTRLLRFVRSSVEEALDGRFVLFPQFEEGIGLVGGVRSPRVFPTRHGGGLAREAGRPSQPRRGGSRVAVPTRVGKRALAWLRRDALRPHP